MSAKPFWGTYVGNNRMLVLTQYGGKLLTYADDLSLTPGLLVDGVFEAGLTNYMLRHIKSGMVVFDIGANLGYFAGLAGMLVGADGAVAAYEPNPEMYALLVDNLLINEMKRHALPVEKAVSNVTGDITFHVSKRFRGNSSAQAHSPQYRADFKSDQFVEITVKSVRFDDYLAVADFPKVIDFIKIDVEGTEYRVLDGMRKFIAAGRVRTLSFEINRTMLQADEAPLKILLRQFRDEQGAVYSPIKADGSYEAWTVDQLFELELITNVLMHFEA